MRYEIIVTGIKAKQIEKMNESMNALAVYQRCFWTAETGKEAVDSVKLKFLLFVAVLSKA